MSKRFLQTMFIFGEYFRIPIAMLSARKCMEFPVTGGVSAFWGMRKVSEV
jgi:hypothetical protein